MKIHRSVCNRTQGVALVIVLALLVLVVAMIVGFLSRAGTERRASSADLASSHLQSLTDMTVNLVQAQINTAAMANRPWASQPGVVRTFQDDGTLDVAYKLYSAEELTSSNATKLRSEDLPPTGWVGQPALWTDLNAWVEYQGERRYPIMDPTIAGNNALAEGFSINATAPTTTIQPAPMPVRWLYVLEDGSLVAPDTSGGGIKIAGSATSPIVGRVAFWTDDDSCKVNINTAGNGTYWDAPYAYTNQEKQLADSQPVQNEYQRYPGHPATTSLRAVFPGATGQELLNYVTPRYRWGGSKEGTVITSDISSGIDLTSAKDRLYSSVDELILDRDRQKGIFSREQVDQRRFLLTAHSNAPELNLFNLPRVAIWPLSVFDDASHRTDLDRLIARAASLGKDSAGNPYPYYFQRNSPYATDELDTIPRNLVLYNYLESLISRSIPGFANGSTFATKYPSGDHQQILTEIFDYIRCTNLHDSLLAENGGIPFTEKWKKQTNDEGGTRRYTVPGHGQVAPTTYNGTMGFGRSYSISEVGLHFICAGDGNATLSSNSTTNLALVAGEDLKPDEIDGNGTFTPRERRLQAMLLLELFSPSVGWTLLHPSVEVEVSGLQNITVDGVIVNGTTVNDYPIFPAEANGMTRIRMDANGISLGLATGANPGVRFPLRYKYAPARGRIAADDPVAISERLGASSQRELYPFISEFFTIRKGDNEFMNVGLIGNLQIKIYVYDFNNPSTRSLVQTITISPSAEKATHIPTLANEPNWWTFSVNPSLEGGAPPYYGRLDGLNGNAAGDSAIDVIVRADLDSNGNPPTSPSNKRSRLTSRWFLPNYDTVVSWIPSHGDFRLVAAANNMATGFVPHPDWSASTPFAATFYDSDFRYLTSFLGGKYSSDFSFDPAVYRMATVDYPSTTVSVNTGDWDTGIGIVIDGPYINKPDEGTLVRESGYPPYYRKTTATSEVRTFFSPARQVPSPGMFGSLPTGVKRDRPWETLLFRPQSGHPNATNPPDHLFMDLFWMPVVEPYVISEPFSTSGKINMNFEILPFTYIERQTGMYAVLRGEKIAMLPNASVKQYRQSVGTSDYRKDLDIPETLSQFTQRFASGRVFISPSEICDLWIVPEGKNLSGMSSFWNGYKLTGDNLRERIYTTLYPRLTTRSNTYTVHMKVQTLKKSPRTPEGEWDEAKGTVTGEYRGSATIERYIDPNNPAIPDYAANPNASPDPNAFYRWRTIASSRFAP